MEAEISFASGFNIYQITQTKPLPNLGKGFVLTRNGISFKFLIHFISLTTQS